MKFLSTYAQNRSILERGWLFAVFYRRIFLRYVRVWRKYHKLQAEHARLEETYRRKETQQREIYEAELTRLDEINETEKNRNKIVEDEWRDKFFEVLRLNGVRFATVEQDDKIRELRRQPFEPQRPKKNAPNSYVAQLSLDERSLYDERRDYHFAAGRKEGYTEAELIQSWDIRQNEIVEDIQREFGSYGEM